MRIAFLTEIIIFLKLESHLWESANILRGPVDAADFKTYIFPLLFIKRISDVYYEEIRIALMEKGLLKSVVYLKKLLEIARELVQIEKDVDPEEEQQNTISALTELFYETRSDATPKIVEKVVRDIDSIVRVVRFPGWQQTHAREREVKKALRKTLLKYQLHHD